jgi:Flp pilus assembly protein TadG
MLVTDNRTRGRNRRGSSLVEGAVVGATFFAAGLGMIDLGIGIFQNHLVSEASRQAARIAAVHGSLAPASWNGGPWGTTAYSGTGNSGDTIGTTLSNAGVFAGLNKAHVNVGVTWPDSGNKAQSGHRVQVTISTTWTPIYTHLFGGSARTLSATSMEPIAH